MRYGLGMLGCCLLLWLQGCAMVVHSPKTPEPTAQHAVFQTMSLNGQWQFSPSSQPPVSQALWRKIRVPSNWYTQGYDHHGVAWYRLEFTAQNPAQTVSTLRFAGVDYFTDVWLNEQKLGAHEGYFQAFQWDVSRHLRTGLNTLLVRVDSPLEKPEDFSLRKRLIKGIFAHHDTRPGGAWSERGQEGNTGGIWGDVTLKQTPQVQLPPPVIQVQPLRDLQHWRVQVALDGLGQLPAGTQIQWKLAGQQGVVNASSQVFTIPVQQPKLWYPRGYGEPYLYTLTLQAVANGQVLDTVERQIGFRKVQKSAQGIWYINNQRLLLKGTNYIANQWLADMKVEDFRRDIGLMQDAHMNAVRVHAHVSAPAFYALCDELGLMVWQDFPLQWGYQDTAEFHQQAVAQLSDMIQQFGYHPSIIQWSLHNEPPWDADWMKWKYKDQYNPQQNRALDERLYATARKLDTSRPIEKYSSTASHPWLGWYSGHWLDYAKPTKQATIAEFGAQALPNRATLARILGEEPSLPRSDADWQQWAYHNFQRKETLEIAKVPLGNNVDALIRNTQAYQAQLIQLAAESYRRQAYRPVGALFHFMLVEDWPSMNWGVVDFWRKPKAGYAALQRAYQPILPSLAWSKIRYTPHEPVRVGLWALNDSLATYPTTHYRVSLFKDHKKRDTKSWQVKLTPDMHQSIADYLVPVDGIGDYRLEAEIWTADGLLLGNNSYRFTIQ